MSIISTKNRREFSFKSVGTPRSSRNKQRLVDEEKKKSIPVGVKTPLRLASDNSGLLYMNKSVSDQIKDNFRNMLMTNHGERLGRPDYGANLLPLCFELASDNGDARAQERIRRATSKYFPYITLVSFEPIVENFDNEHVLRIGAKIIYKIPRYTNDLDHMVEFLIFYAG